MIVDITGELVAFTAFSIAGVSIAVLYDIIRAMRENRAKNYMAWDLVFWLIAVCLCTFALIKFNSGELRIFLLASLTLSGFIYFMTISPMIYLLIVKFLKIFDKLFVLLLTPIRFSYKMIYVGLGNLKSLFLKLSKKTFGGNHENKFRKNLKKHNK